MKVIKYSKIYKRFVREYGQVTPWEFCDYPKVLQLPDIREDIVIKSMQCQINALIRYTRAQKLMIERREAANICYPCIVKLRKCQECGNLFKADTRESKLPKIIKVAKELLDDSDYENHISRKQSSKSLCTEHSLLFHRSSANLINSNSNNNCIGRRESLLHQNDPCSRDKCISMSKSKTSNTYSNCNNDDDADDISLLDDISDKVKLLKFNDYVSACDDCNACNDVRDMLSDISLSSSDSQYKKLADNVYIKACTAITQRISPTEIVEIIDDIIDNDNSSLDSPIKKCFTWFKNKIRAGKKNKTDQNSKKKKSKVDIKPTKSKTSVNSEKNKKPDKKSKEIKSKVDKKSSKSSINSENSTKEKK